MPVLQQSDAVGHAVNCATLMVSLADVGVPHRVATIPRRGAACGLTRRRERCFVTAAIGSTGNEGFGEPYALPNISAYSETCAVLMFMDAEPSVVPRDGRREIRRRARARDVQQRVVGRVSDGESILLHQSARERRRRTGRTLGARFLGMLPAEPRSLSCDDAGLRLCAGTSAVPCTSISTSRVARPSKLRATTFHSRWRATCRGADGL
jgi:hypothetical protein